MLFSKTIQSVPYELVVVLLTTVLWCTGFHWLCILGWTIENGILMREVNGKVWYGVMCRHLRLYLSVVLLVSIFQTISLYGVGSLLLLGFVLVELNYEEKLYEFTKSIKDYISWNPEVELTSRSVDIRSLKSPSL